MIFYNTPYNWGNLTAVFLWIRVLQLLKPGMNVYGRASPFILQGLAQGTMCSTHCVRPKVMSPFSANIILKKTLIRDNAGSPIIPSTFKNHDEEIAKNYEKVTAEIKAFKVAYTAVQSDLEEVMAEHKSNLQVIKNLWDTIAKTKK